MNEQKSIDYLSEEELLHLIALSEEQGLLSAPKSLKADILAQEARLQGRKQQNRRNLISYSLRVALATAACLALLFTTKPFQDGQRGPFANQTGSAAITTEKAETEEGGLSQKLALFTDRLGEQYQSFNQQLTQQFFDNGGSQDEQPAE
jgi:hypothetical protein